MEEKENILNILKQTKEAIKNRDVLKLRELSNQTIHTVSIHKDTDNISVAIIVYAIGKIMEEQTRNKECTIFCQNASVFIDSAIRALSKDDLKGFKTSLEQIIKSVKKLSPNLRNYIKEVFRAAKIDKATKIYEHGISMEQTAKMFGITMFELAGQAGESKISDTPETKTVNESERIKFIMDMFS